MYDMEGIKYIESPVKITTEFVYLFQQALFTWLAFYIINKECAGSN